MNTKKDILKKYRKLLAGVTAGGMLLAGTGCAKNPDEEKTNDDTQLPFVSVVRSEGNVMYYLGEYKYFLDVDGFENEYLDFSETTTEKVFANTIKEDRYIGTVNNMDIVWPECYNSYLSDKSLDEVYENFQKTYKTETLRSEIGEFMIATSKITAQKDLRKPIKFLPYDVPQEAIHKGDTMESVALYAIVDGQKYLVARKQSGVGSDSANVVNATVGNLDTALTTLADYGYDESFAITEESADEVLNDIIDKVNGKADIMNK